MPLSPEAQARQQIDALLVPIDWILQDVTAVNVSLGPHRLTSQFRRYEL